MSEQKDLQQLKQLIPGLDARGNASQVDIMNGAAKYIDQLQNSLVCRIRTHGYPDKLKSYSSGSSYQDSQSIKNTVDSYFTSNSSSSSSSKKK